MDSLPSPGFFVTFSTALLTITSAIATPFMLAAISGLERRARGNAPACALAMLAWLLLTLALMGGTFWVAATPFGNNRAASVALCGAGSLYCASCFLLVRRAGRVADAALKDKEAKEANEKAPQVPTST